METQRDRERGRGHAAGLGAGPSAGRVRHPRRAGRARRAWSRRGRRAGVPVGLVRVLQRSGRERLVGPADPAARLGAYLAVTVEHGPVWDDTRPMRNRTNGTRTPATWTTSWTGASPC